MVEEQPAPDASAPSRTGAIAVKCRSLFKPMILIRRSSPRASFIKSSASRSQESDQCTAATTAGFSCAGYMPRPTLGTIDAHLPLARRGKVNVVEASPEGIPHRACAMGWALRKLSPLLIVVGSAVVVLVGRQGAARQLVPKRALGIELVGMSLPRRPCQAILWIAEDFRVLRFRLMVKRAPW